MPLRSLIGRMLDAISDLFDTGYSSAPETPPHAEPLLAERPLSGSFFRLHSRNHIYKDDFWKTFLDGDWKWEAQERFAGANLNCGHFFGMTEAGARAEAHFYGVSDDRSWLEVKASFGKVLDLTDLGCMRYLIAQQLAGLPSPGTVHLEHLLAFLLDERGGGNAFTDDIGYWAGTHGYDGILFYSARAVSSELRDKISTGKDYSWELDEACGFTAEAEALELQQNLSIQNFVALSGAGLTSAISEFRVEGEPWRPNPYHGFGTDQLDAILRQNNLPFDSEYQRDLSESIIKVAGSVNVKPWRQGDGDQKHPR